MSHNNKSTVGFLFLRFLLVAGHSVTASFLPSSSVSRRPVALVTTKRAFTTVGQRRQQQQVQVSNTNNSSFTNNNMATPSFYQRQLPETCVAFCAKEGKQLFASAMANQGLKTFFPLIEQFTTQSEPAYCGLSTLVLVLNALSVDPRQNWKGPWRWYEEYMLNCCIDLEQAKLTGITLKDFSCLARCQGLSVEMHYAQEDKDDENDNEGLRQFRQAVQTACVEDDNDDDDDDKDNHNNTLPLTVLVISYSRKVLGQTGSGHFSPIGAYDPVSDSVLILDTARFKYGAHWVKLPLVYKAMKPIDPDTGKPRGFVLLSFTPHHQHYQQQQQQPKEKTTTTFNNSNNSDDDNLNKNESFESVVQPMSMLFRAKMSQQPARRMYKEFLALLPKPVRWQDIDEFWGSEYSSSSNKPCVWDIIEPLRAPPEGTLEKQAVDDMRSCIKGLLKKVKQKADNTTAPVVCCKDEQCHKICVTPNEAKLIVYLASIPETDRHRIVMEESSESSSSSSSSFQQQQQQESSSSEFLIREQLLVEAELIASAIEVSDALTTF